MIQSHNLAVLEKNQEGKASRETGVIHYVVKYKDDRVSSAPPPHAQKSTLWASVKQSLFTVISMINIFAMLGSGLDAPQLSIVTRAHVLSEKTCHSDKV